MNSEEDAKIKIESFIYRLKKIGIDVILEANYSWVYITHINSKRVKEKFRAEHGFTIGFLPIRRDQGFEFTDIAEIFKLIRKYR